MTNSVTGDSFDRLLNEVAPISRFFVGRSRPRERTSSAERPRRSLTKEEKLSKRNKYATEKEHQHFASQRGQGLNTNLW